MVGFFSPKSLSPGATMSPTFKDSYLTCCMGLSLGALLSSLSVLVLQTTMLENDPFVLLCRHTLGAMVLFGACILTGVALVSAVDFVARCFVHAWMRGQYLSDAISRAQTQEVTELPRESTLEEAFADLGPEDSAWMTPPEDAGRIISPGWNLPGVKMSQPPYCWRFNPSPKPSTTDPRT